MDLFADQMSIRPFDQLTSPTVIAEQSTVSVKNSFQTGVFIEPIGPWPGKQERKERGSIVSHFKDRFVHQLLQKVLAPNVDDKGDGGLQCRDISKVLFGDNTKIDAAWFHCSN
jgi:hypothetical protein